MAIDGAGRDYWARNARIAPESPSRIVIMKNWHQICSAAKSFVRPRQSHSFVPTADFSRRRVERRSRTALLQRRRRLVLDGREHDGMLPRVGAERDRHDNPDHVRRIDRVPGSASHALYSVREVLAGSPSIRPIARPSKYVIPLRPSTSAARRKLRWSAHTRNARRSSHDVSTASAPDAALAQHSVAFCAASNAPVFD